MKKTLLGFVLLLTALAAAPRTSAQQPVTVKFVSALPAACSSSSREQALAYKYTATAGLYQCVAGTWTVVTVGTSAASTTDVLTGTNATKYTTPDSVAALWEQGSNVASSGTISLGEGGYFHVTGTTTITDIDFATDKAGRTAVVVFDGALTLTHNASTLILPGGTDITTAAGDVAVFVSEGSDAVRAVAYRKASGLPTVLQTTVSGNAGTATQLAADPADCSANNFATAINASGTLTCAQPSISAGVSGLGTGEAAALAVNSGSAGAPVLFNGPGGTPSSLIGMNISGTAPSLTAGNVTTNANLTGDVTSVGNAATIAANAVTMAKHATQATNTVIGNATSGTAVPSALPVGTCSTAASALIWTTNTGFGCNTSITAASVSGFTAGAGVLTGPASAGVAVTLGNNETITGIKTFSPTARSSGTASYHTFNVPADTGITANGESIGINFVTATRTWADGTVALQRERFFAGVTYNKTTTSATFTDIFNTAYTQPVAGSGVTFTRPHTLGILDSTSASSSITGGLIVATTYGTAATSVGIGGGNVNAGGNGTFGGTLSVTGHDTLEGVTSTGATGTGKHVYDISPNFTTGLTINSGTALTAYVEGTWTPVVTFGAASVGITYTTRVATYTRIGDLVYIQAYILLSSKGSSTGVFQITGLPVAPTTTANQHNYIGVNLSTITYTGVPYAVINPSVSIISLYVNNGGTVTALADTNATNTTDILITGVYRAN